MVAVADPAVAAAEKIGGSRWVIKVQVHAGGRGKAGGVKLVDSEDEIRAFANKWLGKRDEIIARSLYALTHGGQALF